MTDIMGQITLREDYDRVVSRISHHRLFLCTDNGVTHETNAVAFTQFVGQDRDNSYGVIMRNSVDVDDLYSYQSHAQGHRDNDLLATRRSRRKSRRLTHWMPN